MKTYISSKIHGVRVTAASIEYNGSVTISRALAEQVGIEQYEQVHVVNLENGNRWVTYALLSDEPKLFTLNGGGAHLGKTGDRCVVMTYDTQEQFEPAKVIFCNKDNQVIQELVYENS